MARTPSRRGWRSFYDQLLKNEKYHSSIDAEKYGPYRTYRQVFIHIDRLLKRYPKEVSALSIGESGGGEPIWVFRSGPPQGTNRVDVRFLVTSLIHPLEFLGTEINLSLLERFTTNRRQNPTLQGREVYFLPILNPDGYLSVERDLARRKPRFRRGNKNGVDLNRNFSAFYSKRYLLHRILKRIYNPGARPFSEPETGAYRSFLLENRFDYAVSLHTFGGYFFYPYGGSSARSRDDDWYARLCEDLVEHQPYYGYRISQLGRWQPFFRARGTETDYLYEVFGTRAIMIEAFRRRYSLLNPRTWMHPFFLFNPRDPQGEIENLMDALFFFLSLRKDGTAG
jgi:carboxypeptidase T